MTNEEFLDRAASLMENIFTLTPEAPPIKFHRSFKKETLDFLSEVYQELKNRKNREIVNTKRIWDGLNELLESIQNNIASEEYADVVGYVSHKVDKWFDKKIQDLEGK